MSWMKVVECPAERDCAQLTTVLFAFFLSSLLIQSVRLLKTDLSCECKALFNALILFNEPLAASECLNNNVNTGVFAELGAR